jgi:serine/threonine-protein kinase RsbW
VNSPPDVASTGDTAGAGDTAGRVELRVPASNAFVALLRSVAAGLAARCDLTLDEIEDLRIAVDEACALMVPIAAADADLATAFTLGQGELVVDIHVDTRPDALLRRDGFGWTVLEALASEVVTDQSADSLTITLTMRREPAAQ